MGVWKLYGSDLLRELSATEANSWPMTNQLQYVRHGLITQISISADESNSQGVSVDVETTQLGRRDLRKVQRHRGLQHADTHAGQQFGDKPMIPT